MEALVVVGISGFTTSLALNIIEENREKERMEMLSSDISDVISGIDKRLSNDKFELNKWNQFSSSSYEFNNRQQVSEFLGKALVAASADGCGEIDGWNPVKDDPIKDAYKDKYRFIDCKLWESKMPFDLNVKAKLLNDGSKVTGFNLDLFFENDEGFIDNFLVLKNVISLSREKDDSNKSGIHQYQLIKDSDGTALSTKECIDEKSNCILRASFTGTDNAYEYLYTNGSNNMIGSKVKFQKDIGDAAIQTCHRYVENSGTWDRVDSVYCGIGMGFKDPGATPTPDLTPLEYVELTTESISTDKIFLNDKCTFTDSGGMNKVVPCGIYNDAGENAVVAVYDEIYSTDALISVIDAVKLNATDASISNNLTVGGTTTLNGDLTVDKTSTFSDTVTIKENPSDPNAVNLVVESSASLKDVDVDGDLEVQGVAEIDGNVNISGSLNIANKLTTKRLKLTDQITVVDLGNNCPENGAITYYSSGAFSDLALCANGKWKLINTQDNQIIAFNGDCPTGFRRFDEAEGRTLVGAGSINDVDTGMTLSYSVGDVGGKAYHALTIDEMPAHQHDFEDAYFSEHWGNLGNRNLPGSNGGQDNDNSYYTRDAKTDTVGGSQAHENRMPFYVVNWCIYEG